MLKCTFLATIRKSGNSWTVRIPPGVREFFQLDEEVKVTIDDGKEPEK